LRCVQTEKLFQITSRYSLLHYQTPCAMYRKILCKLSCYVLPISVFQIHNF